MNSTMKLLSNVKSLFTEHIATKDFALRLSQLGQIWDKGLDLFSGKKGRPAKPYSQVEWVWLCTNLLIDTCKTVPLMLSNANDEILESGPLYDFVYSKDFSMLFQETLGFYILFREVYWITLESTGKSPTKILIAGPNSCEPVTEKGVVVGYRLHTAGGRDIGLLLEDVFVIKNFNPDDPNHGVGPLVAGTMAISTAYQATQYNESLLANGARLSVGLTVPAGTQLKPEEIEKLKREFSSKQGGAANAGKVLLMTGIDDIKTFSQTMADLQMVDLSKFTAGTICSMFGVPPEVVGLNSEAQYAHGPATQRLILYGVSPLLSAIADAIDEGLIQRYGYKSLKNQFVDFTKSLKFFASRFPLRCRKSWRQKKITAVMRGQSIFAWFDIESHPAIQELMRDQISKILPLAEKGVPMNFLIDAYDMPFDTTQMPWGNEWWIPMGQVPARYILEGGIEALTGPAMPEGQTDEEPETPPQKATAQSPETREKDSEKSARIWRKWSASWLPIEQQMTESVRGLLREQFKELRGKLAEALGESKSVKTDTDQIVARIVFDISTANKKIKVINHVFFEKASKLGIAQTLTEIEGLKADALQAAVNRIKVSPAVRRALEISSTKITTVNATTQARVANQLRIGLEKGEGLTDLTNRLSDIFDRPRAGRIARTQVSGGVSAGRSAGMVDAGVEKKGWLTSRDKNVRDEHKAAEQNYKDGIPINEPFIVGGDRLMYPADPAGSAAMIANCRCLQVAVFAKGKAFDLDFYDRLKFVSYDDIKSILSEV
jgi:HK97 family phage portal protein